MKLRILKEDIYETLSRAQSVVERKSTRPILENILLCAEEDTLTVSATDLRISMTQRVGCRVEGEGAVSLPSKKLHEIIREMPDGEITIEAEASERVTIMGGKSTFHLPGLDREEYPSVPEATGEFTTISSALFEQMVTRTIFAASTDETRLYLCGVFMKEWQDEKNRELIKMVATDGHRLSMVDYPVEEAIGLFSSGIIIPKKGIQEVKSLLSLAGEALEISSGDGRLFVRAGNVILSITLIDQSFPNYEQVVPARGQEAVLVPCQALRDALRRVSLLSDQETKSVIMDIQGTQMVLSADNPTLGDAKEIMDVDYVGSPLRVAFNASYLMDILKVIEDDSIKMEIKDSISPALFCGTDKDVNFVSVVMPMRID